MFHPVQHPPSAARFSRRALSALIITTLAACASSGGQPTRAKPIDADQLVVAESLSSTTLSAATWPRDAWWADVGDDQLDRLMSEALRGQPSLRIAEARVREAEAVAGIVKSTLYPQINGSLKSTRQRFGEHALVPRPIAGTWDSVNDASLGVNYELDFWGKNHAAVDAALDRASATEVDLQAARLILTTTLARTYLRLDLAYAQLDLAQDTLAQREKTLELTRQRVAAQIDSQLELTQAEAALPEIRERIASIHESIALINNQIASLEGKAPDAGLTIQRPHLAQVGPVALPTNLPAELIGRRPDVVAERWRVEAARQDITVAKAQFYPNVSLNAFVGSQSLGLSEFLSGGSRVLGIGPAISLPIFEGGRLRSNLGAHQAEYDAAVEKYNATVIAAIHDVVDQLVSLHWLEQEIQEQDDALRLTQHAYDLATNRYRSGLANYLQVLSAESQVLAQKRLAIESQTRQRELRLNLIRALGGGYAPWRAGSRQRQPILTSDGAKS
ncbi:efflux transporter outer membrane subunit [Dyella subtropica]|uniref:efflux transporter outer membrane subunit n=1 Tax=Dyella subtropica TaxID=2992127 RepID=UPI00224FD2F1|nr:efflux transporter outer membrane subunit [Dyella subtropica]